MIFAREITKFERMISGIRIDTKKNVYLYPKDTSIKIGANRIYIGKEKFKAKSPEEFNLITNQLGIRNRFKD